MNFFVRYVVVQCVCLVRFMVIMHKDLWQAINFLKYKITMLVQRRK